MPVADPALQVTLSLRLSLTLTPSLTLTLTLTVSLTVSQSLTPTPTLTPSLSVADPALQGLAGIMASAMTNRRAAAGLDHDDSDSEDGWDDD